MDLRLLQETSGRMASEGGVAPPLIRILRQEMIQSIKNQITLITEYAEKQGVNICETYIDDGISGTTSERLNLERMINDII